MLGSINSEACYTNIDEMVHVIGNFCAHIVLLQGQIKKARQATVPNLGDREEKKTNREF